jgi:hypothetical protein
MLILLVIISVPLQSYAEVEVSNDLGLGNMLKQMEAKKENDLKSIWDQLVLQEKIDHYEVHKSAYENQYNQMVSALRNGEFKINNDGKFVLMGDNDHLYWPDGGVVHYKSTPTSYHLEIMEYYKPDDVVDVYWEWSMGRLPKVSNYVDYIATDVLFSVSMDKYGLLALPFSYLSSIENYLTMNRFLTAKNNGDGIGIHYYEGPFADPSAVVWIWDTHPFVYPPNSDMYDVIEYYMN